ncbi:MAG: N-acetylmuramoyl-L-alanine amidase [Bythopirellula sp.]|nr:N-acetylmuramoyl-L-alanine amidase [Bythopirellula sp.]
MNSPKPRRQKTLAEKLSRAFTQRLGLASRMSNFAKRLRYETLEPRIALAAAGLVEVGTQPLGGLADKIAYIHPGHGYENTDGSWNFQRSESPGTEMIEDLGTYDQMTFLADYLFRAGATVVPLRPIGHQTNEIVLDNDDAGVTFTGTWSNSSATIFYGAAGDVPYKFATSDLTETATARYQPNIAEAGFYPVYAWATHGSNRATDQLYRVTHSGGSTEVTINHRRVGNGLVYLGTYYFETGTGGYVEISNRSSVAGNAIIADMIRFGNGIGTSGQAREDEASLYWIQRHAAPPFAQGISSAEYGTSVVSAAPRFAEFMNREADGVLADRVFVSYHSNAFNGTARGVVGLYNNNAGGNSSTPNQFDLALKLANEINVDIIAQAGQFENSWNNRGSGITLGSSFGEINNDVINNEFDATIVEVAFHDNIDDAELMRDAKFRDATARATYQGLIKYFRARDGNTTSATELPAPMTGVHAESNALGSVTLSWVPPVANTFAGGATTGYRIYVSANGYGFDGGTYVDGEATTTATLTGYDPTIPYYFKIVAVNNFDLVPVNVGGESQGSEVLTVLPSGGSKQVLIVNGFDRLDRSLNPRQTYPSPDNTVDRVRPRESNSRDYTVQVAAAIEAAAPGVRVESTSNEAITSGMVNLANYEAVIWISGEESTGDETFSATEQTLVASYLTGGGKLLVSGAEIGWDLDRPSGPTAADRSFFNNNLKADYVSDDAGTYNVQGAAGSIFDGLSFSFDNGSQFYNVEFPDVINAFGGSISALTYVGGLGGGAGVQFDTGTGTKLVNLAFPFETITTAANRATVMDRVLDFFGVSGFEPTGDFDEDDDVDGRDFLAWQRGVGTASPTLADGDADGNGVVNGDDLVVWQTQYDTPPPVVALSALAATEEEVALTAEQLASAARVLAPNWVAGDPSRAADSSFEDSATTEMLSSPLPLERQEAVQLQVGEHHHVGEISTDRDQVSDRAEFDLVFAELGKLLEE